MPDDDAFADVGHEISRMGFGTLGGEGIDHHDHATVKQGQNGIHVQCRCEKCGAMNVISVDWMELIVINTGRVPPEWFHDERTGLVFPHKGCAACHEQVRTGFTPDECTRHLKSGIAARRLTSQFVQQVQQQLNASGVQGVSR